jgi:hypothetical protein
MTVERNAATEFSQRVDHPYWAGLADGVLRVQRCARCAAWQWPADWRCPTCGSYEFEWPRVEPQGRIYSWTRTHYPFVPGYADLLPYVTVLVELPQAGGARLLGLLRDSATDPRIGEEVLGEFEPARPETVDLPVVRWRKVA